MPGIARAFFSPVVTSCCGYSSPYEILDMVDKLTPRLGLPEPFLTNPLKVDVGRLQQALEMIDSNAVMLTDWDITADGWQKMGTIKGLAQGKIAASLMVVTGPASQTSFSRLVTVP